MEEEKKKKEWSRPECARVKLVPEEAMIQGCKTPMSSGPVSLTCQAAGGPPCQGADVS